LGDRFDEQDAGGVKASLDGKSIDWLRNQVQRVK
jgi:hypothetical protein